MVLIGLLYKHFIDNLKKDNLPSHVIHVSKQDLLNIEEIRICFEVSGVNLTDSSIIDLSNLKRLSKFQK